MLVNLLIFTIGIMIGSFLNVLIHRLPREESIVFPGSHCPKCSKAIKPYDNIPIISYLLLLGKCRYCKNRISIRYPIVETITGIVFLFIYQKTGLSINFACSAIFISSLIVAFGTDLEHFIIPDEIIVLGMLNGFFYGYINGTIKEAILASALGFALFFTISKIAKLFYKKDAIGFGDLKLAAIIGAFLGIAGFWNTFLWAYLSGAIISLILILIRVKKMDDYIPFGPFLIIGALITFFFGHQLILLSF